MASLLSAEQVEAYLDRISLPASARILLKEGPNGSQALEAVTILQQHHMAAVPFENLDLHYSSHRSLPQQTESVYDTVVRRQRGGTCPQVHQLFSHLLRAFGFSVYCTGARLNASASPVAKVDVDRSTIAYGPLIHVATLVEIQGRRHLVDTNLGPAGSPSPVPLQHDKPEVDIWPRRRRMIYDTLPGMSSSDGKWWRLQVQEPDHIWMDVCCFTETEWTPVDFEIMVSGIGQLGAGWFRSLVVCYRIILEDSSPVGYLLMLHDELRRYYKGRLTVVQKLYSEEERVTLLREDFGVNLSSQERKSISGTVGELKDADHDFYG
ncbi:cysteine proteinase [Rhypophila decipiens]|uniref:Cysteine proteinase n=1 Tax=Rhypophila decipiens TaxID=261697 RepID=A0AAN7BDR4_9PEZI|nr:cysteine proteinase [Rhypophila decipiens]